MKKKILLGLALVAGLATALVAVGFTPVITNTAGKTVVAARPSILDSVVIGGLTGNITVNVYDSAAGTTTTASLLRYSIAIPAAVTQTGGTRTYPLGGYFKNGITVSTDGNANTLTATWHTLPAQ